MRQLEALYRESTAKIDTESSQVILRVTLKICLPHFALHRSSHTHTRSVHQGYTTVANSLAHQLYHFEKMTERDNPERVAVKLYNSRYLPVRDQLREEDKDYTPQWTQAQRNASAHGRLATEIATELLDRERRYSAARAAGKTKKMAKIRAEGWFN